MSGQPQTLAAFPFSPCSRLFPTMGFKFFHLSRHWVSPAIAAPTSFGCSTAQVGLTEVIYHFNGFEISISHHQLPKAINWEQFLVSKGTIHWHFPFIKEIKSIVQKLNKHLGYSYKGMLYLLPKPRDIYQIYRLHRLCKSLNLAVWQLGRIPNFAPTPFRRKCWLVSQKQTESVTTTLSVCFCHKPLPAPVRPVTGSITQQPAVLLRGRTMGVTSTSPATSTRLRGRAHEKP